MLVWCENPPSAFTCSWENPGRDNVRRIRCRLVLPHLAMHMAHSVPARVGGREKIRSLEPERDLPS